MFAAKLKSLLAKGRVVSDKLEKASSLCDDWYAAEPSIETFTLRSLFRDLIARGWDDAQGVPSAQYKPFKDGVLPHLVQVVDVLASAPNLAPTGQLDALIIAYRDSLATTP